MSQDLFGMFRNGGEMPGGAPFPVDVRFGEASAAIPCGACRRLDHRGFFVVYKNQAMLVCIKCVLSAISKYQDMHPTEKLLEIDADVDDSAYKNAVEALRDKRPDLSESDALELAKAVINAIG